MKNKAIAVHSVPEMTENRANGCQDFGHRVAGALKQFGMALLKSDARIALVIMSVAAIWSIINVPAMAQSIPGIGVVMTYNVNEGTDFQQVVGTTSLQGFLLGVG